MFLFLPNWAKIKKSAGTRARIRTVRAGGARKSRGIELPAGWKRRHTSESNGKRPREGMGLRERDVTTRKKNTGTATARYGGEGGG
jgi:hypothetical protein